MLQRILRLVVLDAGALKSGDTSLFTILRRRLSAVHVNHKRVAHGALLIAVLSMVAKIAAVGREVAIARRYGISGVLDAYQIAVTITTVVPVMIGGIAASVLVPRLIAVRSRDSDRNQFVNEFNGTVVVVCVAMVVLTWIAAPYASQLLAGAGHANRLRLTTSMSIQMAPVAGFTVGIAYLCARLQSRERYGYSVTDAVPTVAITTLVLVSSSPGDPLPLVLGNAVGSLLQLLLLLAMTRRGDAPLGSISFRHRSHEWQSLYGSILLMGLGQLLLATAAPIDQAFAARIGEGAVATLGYANRIVSLLTSFGTIVVTRALLPVLAGSVADGHLRLARRQAFQWAMLLGAAGALIVAVLWIAAPTLVRLMFQRGAFTAAASTQVSTVLQFGLLQLPLFFAGMAIVQLMLALRRYRALMVIAAVAICIKVLLNLVFIPIIGLGGIMVATAGMYACTLVGQAMYVRAAG